MSKPKKAEYGYIREAFNVRRYHTVGFVAQEDTVGKHTANVVAMLFYMYDDNPPIEVIRYALHHDVPELATGDIPATAKWRSPVLKKALDEIEEGVRERQGLMATLPEADMNMVKFADMMELCFKSVEEMMFGNEAFGIILANGLNFCLGMMQNELKGNPKPQEVYNILMSNPFIDIQSFLQPKPSIIAH